MCFKLLLLLLFRFKYISKNISFSSFGISAQIFISFRALHSVVNRQLPKKVYQERISFHYLYQNLAHFHIITQRCEMQTRIAIIILIINI